VSARTRERPLSVAIDVTQVDNQTLGWGQFRYAVDLVNGIATSDADVHLILLGSAAAPREEFAPALGRVARCRYVSLPPYRGPGQFYVEMTRLAWCLARNRVDAVHEIHTNLPFPKVCPVVVTAYHYYDDPLLFASRPHRYYRWSLRQRADLVIAISNATREDVHRHYGVPLDRMRTVYPGLSPTLSCGTGGRRPRPYLLSPYVLSVPKNLRSLIASWPAIAGRHPDVQLVLYGESHVGPDMEREFERLLGATPHADRIERVGHVDDRALADLFAGCSLFVFPTTVEGFGYPLVEAMAHGACCITRDASAMKEVGGDAVCLVETLNPTEISRAVLELLADAPRRAALTARATARAQEFTIGRMIRGTVDCYRTVTS
jgi:glycosyltransferase involved in cell wall biosynthesis